MAEPVSKLNDNKVSVAIERMTASHVILSSIQMAIPSPLAKRKDDSAPRRLVVNPPPPTLLPFDSAIQLAVTVWIGDS